MPVHLLTGIVCHDHAAKDELDGLLRERSIELTVVAKPSWYF